MSSSWELVKESPAPEFPLFRMAGTITDKRRDRQEFEVRMSLRSFWILRYLEDHPDASLREARIEAEAHWLSETTAKLVS